MNLSNVTNIKMPEGNVVKIVSGSDLLWEKDYSKEYFTIEFYDDTNTKNITIGVSLYNYSFDKQNWIAIDKGSTITTTARKVYFKGTSTYNNRAFVIDTRCKLSGNLASLIKGDDFLDKTPTFYSCYAFLGANYTVEDLSNLILPEYCYKNSYAAAFQDNRALRLPPKKLPTNFPNGHSGCFHWMFVGCPIEYVPELPVLESDADTLFYNFIVYSQKYKHITIPITRIQGKETFYQAFQYAKLESIKVGFKEITSTTAFTKWMEKVTTTGVLYKPSDATYDDSALNLPSTWTVETY